MVGVYLALHFNRNDFHFQLLCLFNARLQIVSQGLEVTCAIVIFQALHTAVFPSSRLSTFRDHATIRECWCDADTSIEFLNTDLRTEDVLLGCHWYADARLAAPRKMVLPMLPVGGWGLPVPILSLACLEYHYQGIALKWLCIFIFFAILAN